MMHAVDSDQERVFGFLSDPATHGGAAVQRIDTHAASVFLAGDRALKVKRAVRFPFLNYSTLALRKAACDDELAVNRRFAPQIYRRVVPITRRRDGSLAIDGSGEPVEWAVEMARFDISQTVDHLAEAGPLPPGLVTAIADVIAASHDAAPRAETAPWVRAVPTIVEGVVSAFRSAKAFPADAIDAFAAAGRGAAARLRPLLESRGEDGLVRHCHGDLHLANIVVIDGKPVLFDAIEFDPQLASIDVLYDLAFPLMDLLHYERAEAANLLLNGYLARGAPSNIDGLATLPLFMAMRAAIRAEVMLARSGRDGPHADAVGRNAAAYFALAQRLLRPPAPRLVAVGGLSGTGKSVLARGLAALVAPMPGAIVLRSDVVRKQRFGVKESERLPPEAYAPEVTEEVYRTLAQQAARILGQGHSVIVDAVFARQAERDAIRTHAGRLNRRFDGLYLDADLATRIARVETRTADASDADAAVVRRQQQYPTEPNDWRPVDASGSAAQTLRGAQGALELSPETGACC